MQRLLAGLERPCDDEDPARASASHRAQPPVAVRQPKSHRPQQRAVRAKAGRLAGREKRRERRRRRFDHRAAPVEQLRECRPARDVAVDEPALSSPDVRHGLGGLRAQRLIDRREQRGSDAEVHEDAHGREDGRHRDGERKCQPEANRHAAHARSRRRQSRRLRS